MGDGSGTGACALPGLVEREHCVHSKRGSSVTQRIQGVAFA